MEWFVENWVVVVSLLAVLITAMLAGVKFLGLPRGEQLIKIKEWLLWAIVEAEKELGSGTGPVKLRFVWDLFISKFPLVSKFITFDLFKSLVDDALVQLKVILKDTPKLAELVPTIKVED